MTEFETAIGQQRARALVVSRVWFEVNDYGHAMYATARIDTNLGAFHRTVPLSEKGYDEAKRLADQAGAHFVVGFDTRPRVQAWGLSIECTSCLDCQRENA